MTIRGILFDKDGTLIDFHRTWIPAYHAGLDALADWTNDPALKQRCLTACGQGDDGSLAPDSLLAAGANNELAAHWAAMSELPDAPDVTARLLQIMEHAAASEPVPLVSLPALFSELLSRNLVLGIATMDAEWVARQSMVTLGCDAYIDFFAGYDSGFGIKPSTGMIEGFCHAVALAPQNVMVVGDSPHDLNMARTAGAGRTVGVLSGVAAADDLTPLADAVIDDVGGLAALLDAVERSTDSTA